jgi:hypothetical protein
MPQPAFDLLGQAEWRMLLTGPILLDSSGLPNNPAPDWLSDKTWGDIVMLAELPVSLAGSALRRIRTRPNSNQNRTRLALLLRAAALHALR